MKNVVTVREFARLTTEPVTPPSLDRAQITVSAFNWLCRAGSSPDQTVSGLVHIDDRRSLRLNNYVGVLETPCGTRIEILPKIEDSLDPGASRRLLKRMIGASIDIPARDVGPSDIESFEAPLSEWVIAKLLEAVNRLFKRGVRQDYTRIEDQTRYLRGQLDVSRQVRLPPGRQHNFEVRHDVFLPDRPENRLLRSALSHVARVAQTPANWRLAQELNLLFREVPVSADYEADFRAWRTDRLMAHYKSVKPWCELVLYRRMPYALVGQWHGISMLFPMERLFERFVADALKRRVRKEVHVRTQAASEYLCTHLGDRLFRLEPDLLIESQGRRWVLDTKWKRVDSRDRPGKYGLSQADMYQLFAYGMKYLGAQGGELVLVYPRTKLFEAALPSFNLGHGLTLHALPFDLHAESLVDSSQADLPLESTS